MNRPHAYLLRHEDGTSEIMFGPDEGCAVALIQGPGAHGVAAQLSDLWNALGDIADPAALAEGLRAAHRGKMVGAIRSGAIFQGGDDE